MIVVIDYGTGNLRSVSKAFEFVGAEVKITNKAEEIVSAEAIVLPGVGAFCRGMENLEKSGILPAIVESIKKDKPFLGICLGLQLLFTESEEHGISKGLDIIKGSVKKFTPNVNPALACKSWVKIPHMGWNNIKLKIKNQKSKIENDPEKFKEFPGLSPRNLSKIPEEKAKIFKDIPDKSYFYFDHSYYVEPEDKNTIIATTEYGKNFVSAVNKDNIWGVQFHPEKSSDLGLKILKNFVELARA